MTAPFSLLPIDSSSLDWPELPELDNGIDVLAPTPWAPYGAAAGWRELGACMDELAATRALTELLNARMRSARHLAAMSPPDRPEGEYRRAPSTGTATGLRASFAVERKPAWRVPVHAGRDTFAMPYRGTGSPTRAVHVSAYGGPHADAVPPPADGASLSVQAWLANLAPLATLALLLGAWFVWLR